MKIEELVIKRNFECSKRELFDAWSNPDFMAKWIFANPVKYKDSTVKNSFNTNGEYKLQMHFEDGDVNIHGIYREIQRYNLIEFTWNSPMAEDSIIRLDFKELSPNRTELVLTQTIFPSEESRQGHSKGWVICMDNLEEHYLKVKNSF